MNVICLPHPWYLREVAVANRQHRWSESPTRLFLPAIYVVAQYSEGNRRKCVHRTQAFNVNFHQSLPREGKGQPPRAVPGYPGPGQRESVGSLTAPLLSLSQITPDNKQRPVPGRARPISLKQGESPAIRQAKTSAARHPPTLSQGGNSWVVPPAGRQPGIWLPLHVGNHPVVWRPGEARASPVSIKPFNPLEE